MFVCWYGLSIGRAGHRIGDVSVVLIVVDVGGSRNRCCRWL